MTHRAAARADGVVLAVAMTYPTVAAWLYFRTYGTAAWMPLLYAVAKVVQFALPLAWHLHAGPVAWRPAARRRAAGVGFATGAGLVAVVAGAWLLGVRSSEMAAFAAPRVAARIEAIGAAGPGRFLALATFLAVAHSFLEEYYWRWFVHGRLRAHLRTPAAIALSSLAFMAHHVIVLDAFTGLGRYAWATVVLSAAVAAAGAMWAWMYERSGGLAPVWISHALADAVILAVGYDLVRGPP